MGFLGKFVLLVALFVGGGMSAWAQKRLPYTYGFENNNLATEGWTIIDGISNTSIQKNGSYGVQVRTGDYSFRFYSGYNKTEYLVSPLLESSSTGIELSFYYKNATANSQETFYVGYSSIEGVGEPQASSFTWLEDALVPAANMSDFQKYNVTINNTSIKYVAIKHVSANKHNVFIDDVTIEAAETYKRPKNFTIDSQTTSSATFSWTAGSDETAWQIAYSTKADFSPSMEGVKLNVTDNPYTLTGLTEGVTYYAYVRSKYVINEESVYSEWCNDKVAFTPKSDISVCSDYNNKTSANVAIPNYTANSSYLTKSQMIYPYSDVSSLTGKYITQLIFYANTSSIDWGAAKYDVYLAETSTASFSYSASFIDWSNCTKVAEGISLTVNDGKLIIDLTTPFLLTGTDSKNLLIGFQQISVSTSTISSTWYAKNITSSYPSAAYYNTGSYTYSTGQSYLPYVTISCTSSTLPVTLGTNGYLTFACPRPLDLANLPTGLKAYKAKVDEANSKVSFTEINQAVSANTGILLAGTAGEPYSIPVADNGTTVTDNDFLVNSTGGTFAAESGYTYYGLIKDSDPLTFGSFEPASVAIPTNKAYLKVQDSATSRLMCVFFDATGISETTTAAAKSAADTTVFDLLGRRVAQPTKGLYIVNGKKVAFK